MNTLVLLLAVHALADYPLQGEFLSKAKNVTAPIPDVPWWQAMGAHCLIHAGGVYLITQNLWLAALEFCCHFTIDNAKCRGLISFNTDQALHVGCKVLWWALA